MIVKSKKSLPYKMSAKAVLGCIVAASMVLSNGVTAKAEDVVTSNISNVTLSNTENTNEKHEFLVDAPLKVYDNIQKTEEISNLKFKLLDYLPDGYKADSEAQIFKLTDTDNSVIKYFSKDRSGMFSFIAFKADPVESLKKIVNEKSYPDNMDVQEKESEIGGVSGTNITIKATRNVKDNEISNLDDNKEKQTNETYDYFVWKDNDIWYCINYSLVVQNSDGESKVFVKISDDDIGKMAKSIKYPEEVTNVSYQKVEEELSTEREVMSIYEKADLQKAEELIGFKPKFPLTINEDIKIKESSVGLSGDSDVKNNIINYELSNFYTNKNGSITFTQGKTSKDYEDIITTGYVAYSDTDKVKAEKLSINNIDVYKLDERSDSNFSTSCVTYLWKDSDTYCSVTFVKSAENSDELVKSFIASKSID